MTNFNPSPQQRAVFDAIGAGDHNIAVDAKAGSGKTTTIVEGTKYVRRTGLVAPDVIFIAFNKNIVTTLQGRTKAYCTTFHALGFRALKDSGIVARSVKVDSAKCRKILWNIMENEDEDFRNVLRLVSLLKSSVHEVEYEEIDPRDLIEMHNIDFVQPERSITAALRVLKTSDNQLDSIDFDDMLHLPIKFNVRFEPREWIFVDEAQDLNAIQHEIVYRLCRVVTDHPVVVNTAYQTITDTRIVAVGDPHQAIYAFRGAMSDSMTILARRFNCKIYPLSVSYRCPKAVVREAQRYLID